MAAQRPPRPRALQERAAAVAAEQAAAVQRAQRGHMLPDADPAVRQRLLEQQAAKNPRMK